MAVIIPARQVPDGGSPGKGSNILVGTAAQVTDNLKRLKEEIMPKVEAS